MRYRWFDTEEHEDEYGQPLSRAAHDPTLQPPPAEGLTKGGATGCVLAAGILLYGLVTWDTPRSCVSMAARMVNPSAMPCTVSASRRAAVRCCSLTCDPLRIAGIFLCFFV